MYIVMIMIQYHMVKGAANQGINNWDHFNQWFVSSTKAFIGHHCPRSVIVTVLPTIVFQSPSETYSHIGMVMMEIDFSDIVSFLTDTIS